MDLRPYHGEKQSADLWASIFSQLWGNDTGVLSNLVENSNFRFLDQRDKFGNLVFKFEKLPKC